MNHLKAYPAHLALYLVGAIDVLAQVPALGALAPYAPWITAAGALSAALHHSYKTGAATAVVEAASSAPVKLMLATMALSIFLGASVLQGCATAPTATQRAGITVAVDIATGAAIQSGEPQSAWTDRAAKFKAVAVKLKTLNDAGTATLATLAAALAPEIASLPPADQLAAHALVAALQPYLDQQVAASPQVGNALETVDVILQAVIDSCGSYGA